MSSTGMTMKDYLNDASVHCRYKAATLMTGRIRSEVWQGYKIIDIIY
ncbi:MAG: hypothetical protein ACR5LA_10705 [Wolbachia sp.]